MLVASFERSEEWHRRGEAVGTLVVEGEPRWLVIGRIDGMLYSAVITYRVGRIRLISVRRSRQEEAAIYEG